VIVVDSSVWIGYFNGALDPVVTQLRNLIGNNAPLAMLPAVLQEVLQGARDDAHFIRIDRLLGKLPEVSVPDPFATARDAARLYRDCRRASITVRSPVDCLIAASCIELGSPLLQRDRDFHNIARVRPKLMLFPVPAT